MKSDSKTLKIEEEESILSSSEFSFSITRVAVVQICQTVGFKAGHRSALETLTDVAGRYLRALAKSAASSANLGGRTQSNILDVVRALEELYGVQGFRGASNVGIGLLSSSTLFDLMKFVKHTKENPFAKPIPRRCFPTASSHNWLSLEGGGGGRGWLKHVPRWLPDLPTEMMDKEKAQGDKKWALFGSFTKREEGWLAGGKRSVETGRKATELPEKRARLRFKMGEGNKVVVVVGMNRRSLVFRGEKSPMPKYVR